MLTKPFFLNRKQKPAAPVYRPVMLPIAYDDEEAMEEASRKPAVFAGRSAKRNAGCNS